MIVELPRRPCGPIRTSGSGGARVWQRSGTLKAGVALDARLTRPGERHLLLLTPHRPVLCTLSLERPGGLILWLLGTDERVLAGPGLVLQHLLEPGRYWVQVSAPRQRPGLTSHYRLRRHDLPLGRRGSV
jgi:hypothetical protein